MTGESTRPAGPKPARPADVDTGFWLWAAALPLLVIGYLIDNLMAPVAGAPLFLKGIAVMIVVAVAAVVLTFLILLRQGYRWTRTLLTAGGFGSMAYTVTNLFTVERESPVAAFGYAVTAIIGSVLIAGGIFLLHRKDSNAFFMR
ncbi:hypothetical protein MDOR_03600 [Mycolicibacterium doricum]|uniref:Transmembrane protein n=1 Tax=Mycolicibacterium doricum TaxID=126673 RepID=A0A1X1T159_9MYCO|nr:hypothetical protein [Mycolicibacterium doricum]MCV7269305.1 hypothetical protein [Mycolicibacterium doricum]ORV37988.1 hypothetical protein AWC01_15240 [Mycolicibacterium doricum]BBZ06191.1 hypothetical protein MDOR_03600 [Mycolicibacterium doricum]